MITIKGLAGKESQILQNVFALIWSGFFHIPTFLPQVHRLMTIWSWMAESGIIESLILYELIICITKTFISKKAVIFSRVELSVLVPYFGTLWKKPYFV